jgi:glutamate dehydrogenase (NAD(P)+)
MFGCKVVAVSDSRGGRYCEKGLDSEKALRCGTDTNSVCNMKEGKQITNEEILILDVDILIPAAIENVITEKNAGKIKTKIIAELANGPTTPEADDILYKNGVHLIPDFLRNAGGVTVSYFEMVQNFDMYYWEEDVVYERLDKKMTSACLSVLDTSKKFKIDMR